MHIAKAVHAARMAPRGMDTPEQCMVAILHGLEVGLTPLAALQRIAVVNGRPTIWGDGALALVRASGLAERIGERIEGERPEHWTAVCEVVRRGEAEPVIRSFSVEDAKRARLWGKAGPWTDYPRRMLQMRARAFALRDAFADVLGGLYLREEIEEEPRRVHVPKAEIGPDRAAAAVHAGAPLEGISEEELEAREAERTDDPSSAASVPPLPPIRSLELRRRLSMEASRLRFRNGWSFRQPKGIQRPPMARAADPGEAERPESGSPTARPEDPLDLVGDRAAVLDLFDDALACARDPDTLSEIIEEFARRLNDLPRDVRLSADILITRHEKRIAADSEPANRAAGGISDGAPPERGMAP